MAAGRESSRKYRDAGKRRMGGLPFHRRHRRLLLTLLTIVGLLLTSVGAYAYHLNKQLSNFGRVDISTVQSGEPDPDEGRALNVLLLGSDMAENNEGGSSIEEDAVLADWPAGKYRSDTLMLVHIPADRSGVQLISIPRDTYTTIYDEDGEATNKQKINAAFSQYGPAGAVATVQALTGITIDHLAIIDWEGFKDITTAVGGVEVTIPETFTDPQQGITWEAGTKVMEGDEALAYVRTRHGLQRGDFDRIARQQNFLRSVMNKLLSRGTLTNPIKLSNTLEALSNNMTLDSNWSPSSLRSLALSLRNVSSETVAFMTAPVATTEDVSGVGNVVILKESQSDELWQAVLSDQVGSYITAYPDEQLPGADEVS
ncbi:LCP family protein [Aeromicrobium sp. Leaf350]|uniref:LCP family protein n=1 Tax=Aeromicrobium sp. Leaf350 TaxID=2876565 RepID=UPI001E520038|nr:LCP family protein [Aeromicrobium sp. Leaf350]